MIDGCMADVPGSVDFHYYYGSSPSKVYACTAETIAPALERRFEVYPVDREITLDRVREINALAEEHGF